MRSAFRGLLPVALLAVFFVLVVHARPTPAWRRSVPQEGFIAERCTWHCHNHGCRHAPVLPGWLTSDAGAFGLTIRGLYALGRIVSADRATGYGVANLAVFCVGWPVGTYGLWLLALRQHRKLKLLKARAGTGRGA